MTRICRVLALTLLAATVAAQEQTLVLKDGRRFSVTEMVRRDGQVVFRTTAGRTFNVPEDRVAAPPLDQIANEIFVLSDGRRIPVRELARRGNTVFFQTMDGQNFSIQAERVVEPPLSRIRSLDPAPPAPEAPAPRATPTPAPARPEEAMPKLEPRDLWADFQPLPDRWEIAYPASPRIVKGRAIDPYNQNRLKGDRPVSGGDVFLVLTATLDAPFEGRRLPVASGVSAAQPGSREFFGDGRQTFTTPRALVSLELFKGLTAFRPKSWAVKATGVVNLNRLGARENNLVNPDVREGKTRTRKDAALEEAFAEVKLADLSRHYDFVSLRAGIQPFVSDFRGFVFADQNLGARVFGNLDGNRWQYNAAVFELLEKDTNSELNTFERRRQQVAVANLFRQDFLTKGYTLLLSYHRSRDDASRHFDRNDFLVRPARIGDVRPHEVKASYFGLAGEGHVGRLNVSHALYVVSGEDEHQPLAGRAVDVKARMAALEASLDRDWLRFKASLFFASGDDDASDEKARGFDAIYDLPNFAGGPFSFWNRSGIALTQTGVLLKGPGSLLPSLRSNKFEGQANFVNPGLLLAGVGVDAELTPKLKLVAIANALRFHKTGALELLLFQPGIRKSVGIDVGLGGTWRPLLNENVVITAGVNGLLAGAGFDDIYSSSCSVPRCGARSRTLASAFAQLRFAY